MAEACRSFPELPAYAGEIGADELQAFVGLKPSRSASRKLPSELKVLLKEIFETSNGLLEKVVSSDSSEEFRERRNAVVPDYVRVQNALANIAKAVIHPVILRSATEAAFSNLDSEVAAKAAERFGEAAGAQVTFTAWAIRRTLSSMDRIRSAEAVVDEADRAKDEELAKDCSFWLWWSLFHVDCMRAAIRLKKSVHSVVVDSILDGLRAAVNAQIAARQALALRPGLLQSQPAVVPQEWDDEDQALLDASMADLEREVATEQDER